MNIFDLKGFLTDRGVTYTENEDGSLTFTTPNNGILYNQPFEFSQDNIVVSLSGIVTNGTATNTRIQVLNGNNSIAGEINENTSIRENLSGCKIRFNWSTNGTIIMKNIKLEKGTQATPYSPYGCGNVNVKVQSKNLFDGELETGGISYQTGNLEVDTAKIRTKNYIAVLPNTSYVFKRTTFPTDQIAFRYYGKNKEYLGYLTIGVKQTQVITTRINGNDIYYIKWVDLSNDLSATYQLEIGSTPTSYVPHSEQTISFPLAQGQKFYEGSHPDDDEKVHHVRGEYVFDGTENWQYIASSTPYFYIDSNSIDVNYKPRSVPVCTHYKGVDNTSFVSNNQITIGNAFFVMIRDTRFTSVEEYKAYLAEQYANGTPVRVVFELAEEVTEDFTEEQKEAWKQIKEAYSYKGGTYISSPDEVKPNLRVQYYMKGVDIWKVGI